MDTVTPLHLPKPLDVGERHTRGAGSGGLGPSGGKVAYSNNGVLIGNYVEDVVEKEFQATGKHLLGFGEPLAATSTQRASYTANGKTGADLAELSKREDQQLDKRGQPGDMLTRHGNFSGPRDTFYATLNSLAYAEKQLDDPRVSSFLWSGNNRHDQNEVPRNICTLGGRTAAKQRQWQEERDGSPFATTSRSALMAAALSAAEQPGKTAQIQPLGDSGQLGQVGRKPKGLYSEECDKAWRRTGLRDIWPRQP